MGSDGVSGTPCCATACITVLGRPRKICFTICLFSPLKERVSSNATRLVSARLGLAQVCSAVFCSFHSNCCGHCRSVFLFYFFRHCFVVLWPPAPQPGPFSLRVAPSASLRTFSSAPEKKNVCRSLFANGTVSSAFYFPIRENVKFYKLYI